MIRPLLVVLLLVAVTAVSSKTNAEIGIPFSEERPNGVYLGSGYDYALFSLELGYGRAFYPRKVDRIVLLNVDFTMPMITPDFKDSRLRVGGRIDTLRYRRFAIPVQLNIIFRSAENNTCRAVGFGTDLSLMPGFFLDKWSIGAEITWDQQWSTYIRHTDKYRELAYPEAKDGWYRVAAFTMRYGLRASVLLKKRVEIMLRGGYEQDGKWDYRTPPFYAVLAANVRF